MTFQSFVLANRFENRLEASGQLSRARTYPDLTIEDWRDEIDRIDEQLVKLLNQRSKCAIELGRIKRELGLAIYSPEREAQVIEHVTGVNGGPLESAAMRRLFERIIDESRRIERVVMEREEREAASRRPRTRKSKAGRRH